MSKPEITLDLLLSFIASASFEDATIIRISAERRTAMTDRRKYTAAETAATFPVGSTVLLYNLADKSVSDRRVSVVGTEGDHVRFMLGGQSNRVSSSNCIPVTGQPDAEQDLPPSEGALVITTGTGKYAGLTGVIVKVGRTGKCQLALSDNTARTLNCVAAGLKTIDKPSNSKSLKVFYKVRMEGAGAVTLYDTSKINPSTPREFNKKYPGITDFGWRSRKEARLIASALGAEFEEA